MIVVWGFFEPAEQHCHCRAFFADTEILKVKQTLKNKAKENVIFFLSDAYLEYPPSTPPPPSGRSSTAPPPLPCRPSRPSGRRRAPTAAPCATPSRRTSASSASSRRVRLSGPSPRPGGGVRRLEGGGSRPNRTPVVAYYIQRTIHKELNTFTVI